MAQQGSTSLKDNRKIQNLIKGEYTDKKRFKNQERASDLEVQKFELTSTDFETVAINMLRKFREI